MTDGTIEFMGERITNLEAAEIVRKGIFQVMEGRHVFEHLTVEENLLAGSYTRTDRRNVRSDLDMVYHYFPKLVTGGGRRPGTSRAGSSRWWPSGGP